MSRLRRPLLTVVLVGLAVLSAGRGAGARADESASIDELGVGHAIVLGLVEGITEFLPVSSTGHLIVSERLMDLGGEKGSPAREALDAYTIIIQFGAIMAILVLSRHRVAAVIQGLLGRDEEGRRLLFNLVAAFGPAAVLGLAFGDAIDDHLLEPAPVAAALIVGGVAILALTPWLRRRRDAVAGTHGLLDDLTVRSALVIGCAQALALWPGTSRSLVTILGGLAVGLSIAAAVEFSFLLGLVTLTAATALSAMKDGGTIVDNYGVATPVLGMVAAGVSAFLAVRSFVNYLNRRDLTLFGWYRIGAGLALVGLMLTTTRL